MALSLFFAAGLLKWEQNPHSASVRGVKHHPQDLFVASASDDTKVKVKFINIYFSILRILF